MRLSPLTLTLALSVLTGCLPDDTVAPRTGTPIDCETLATTLAASEPTLTTTASGLKYRDQTVGTGATITTGQRVAIHYSGCLTTGLKFDESTDADPVYVFTIGATPLQAIKGINEGVIGMKVGGRRQLVIPPELGYGNAPIGQIPANSTIVFTIDLVAVQP